MVRLNINSKQELCEVIIGSPDAELCSEEMTLKEAHRTFSRWCIDCKKHIKRKRGRVNKMGLTNFEKEIMHELKTVTGKTNLTGKNLMEWRFGTAPETQAGEKLIKLPSGVYVCYTEPEKKRDDEK